MKFSETHEWVTVDDQGVGTVGVSRYALRELGEVVYVELPAIGEVLAQFHEACVLESTKAAADIYSPVSGTVVAVNNFQDSRIAKLNQSPEGEGWLYRIRLQHPEELSDLLSKDEYLNECCGNCGHE